MTLTELQAARATSGARYAAAVTELRASLIELASMDMALANERWYRNRYGNDRHGGGLAVRTFGMWPDPIAFRHPVYAPDVGGHWQSEANAAHQAILASATPTGDAPPP